MVIYDNSHLAERTIGMAEIFFGSEISDMKSAIAELSKRNGSEPPKDLNKAH